MGLLRGAGTLARSGYRDITYRPLYTLLLLLFSGMIFLSQYVTLFSFYQEMTAVREMGMAGITFFGFLIIVTLCGAVVTQELEDRTAITLLSKPISRAAFLVGKFFGLILAIAPGVFILASVLFITLWMMALPTLYGSDAALWQIGHTPGEDSIPVMQHAWNPNGGNVEAVGKEVWGCLHLCWRFFVLSNGGVVLQGAFLSFLQVCILAAIGVSMAAFTPVVVSAGTTALLFILGNISSYMLHAVETWNIGPLSWIARALYYVLPNLGYFNLQTFFSEGRIVSLRYLGFASLYAGLYTFTVFLISCAAFRRREIR